MRAAEFAERESDMLPEGDRFVMIRVHRGAEAAQSVQDPIWIVQQATPRPSSANLGKRFGVLVSQGHVRR